MFRFIVLAVASITHGGAMNTPQSSRHRFRSVPEKFLAGQTAAGHRMGKRSDIIFDKVGPSPTCKDISENLNASSRGKFAKKAQRVRKYCEENNGMFDNVLPVTTTPAFDLQRKTVQYLHVSKTGGTFLCLCANAHGANEGANSNLPIPEADMNCHYLEEDWPMWGTNDSFPEGSSEGIPEYATTSLHDEKTNECSDLITKYNNRGITFEGNENYLANNGELCPDFFYVLVTRDPVYRLVSHLSFMTGSSGTKRQTVDEIFEKYPTISDNYLTRLLGGNETFRKPFGNLTEDDYSKALENLQSFDAILVMGDSLTKDVKDQFGWTCDDILGRVSDNDGGTEALVTDLKKLWGEKDYKRLATQNVYDKRLFDQSQLLSFINTVASKLPSTDSSM